MEQEHPQFVYWARGIGFTDMWAVTTPVDQFIVRKLDPTKRYHIVGFLLEVVGLPIFPFVEREEMNEDMSKLLQLSNERGAPKETFYRFLAHSPKHMLAFGNMWNSTFFEGDVEHSLKEIVRLNIAFHYGCPF